MNVIRIPLSNYAKRIIIEHCGYFDNLYVVDYL